MFIKDFKRLIAYQKLIALIPILIQNKIEAELFVAKIGGYIAKANTNTIYPKEATKNFRKAIKWTNALERRIREQTTEDKEKLLKEIGAIRRILITLNKKVGGQ